ncbi:oligosaccharide flippase family protein [Phenylobacterium sp.]|uniref:oligosaccharide flippase family protein n=1 Tax=Phenylobacterium sp. TaxID=1871053 RepID=UPI003567AF0D
MAVALRQVMNMRHSAQAGKVLRGGAWSFAGYGAQTALRFISRIVLAKLLISAAPLGTVAVVTTILMGLEMISDLGINVNIVQHRDGADARFLGTAFSVQVLRSGALYLLASAMAFPIAWIYHDPQLAPLLLFGAAAVLFRGFVNPGLAVLTREVALRRPTIVAIISEAAGFIVTVAWALKQPSAWALVAGSVATAAAFAIASQFAAARARFSWDSTVARGIVQFGGWIILSTGTYFLSSRGEVLMLKGSVPDVEFGCFAFATMLVTTPVSAVIQLGSQVLLPMLAGWIREDKATALRQFRRVKWAFTGLGVCVAWGAILIGPPFVALLHLNKSYAGLGWMVQFLGFRAAFDIFAIPAGSALLASGASLYSAFANSVRLVVLIAGLWLMVHVLGLGLPGAMWVLMVVPFVAYSALMPGLRRHMPGTMGLEAATLLTFIAGGAAAAGLALALGGMWTTVRG